MSDLERAVAHYNQGLAHIPRNENVAAIEEFLLALAAFRGLGDKRGQADTLHLMGLVYMSMRRSDDAIACYEEARELCQQVKNRIGVIKNLNGISVAHEVRGDMTQALAYVDAVIALYNTHKADGFLKSAQKRKTYLEAKQKRLSSYEDET